MEEKNMDLSTVLNISAEIVFDTADKSCNSHNDLIYNELPQNQQEIYLTTAIKQLLFFTKINLKSESKVSDVDNIVFYHDHIVYQFIDKTIAINSIHSYDGFSDNVEEQLASIIENGVVFDCSTRRLRCNELIEYANEYLTFNPFNKELLKKIVWNGYQIIIFRDDSFITIPIFKHDNRQELKLKKFGLNSNYDVGIIRFCINRKLIKNND